MTALPASAKAYQRTPVFTQDTVPASLLKDHKTKAGTWGVITVVSGRLQFTVPSLGLETTLEAGETGIAEPEVTHRVEPQGPVAFYVEFWR